MTLNFLQRTQKSFTNPPPGLKILNNKRERTALIQSADTCRDKKHEVGSAQTAQIIIGFWSFRGICFYLLTDTTHTDTHPQPTHTKTSLIIPPFPKAASCLSRCGRALPMGPVTIGWKELPLFVSDNKGVITSSFRNSKSISCLVFTEAAGYILGCGRTTMVMSKEVV